jgi:hypothetical protein
MRIPERNEIDRAIQSLGVFGYAKMPCILNDKEVQAIKAKVTTLYDGVSKKIDYSGRPDRDARDKLVYNLQNKDKLFIELLDHAPIKEVLKHFLNDPYYRFIPADYPNYYLSYYNARSSGNSLDLHLDSHIPLVGERTFSMQCIFVIDQFNEENGCSVVIPGSHKSGNFSDRSLPPDLYTKLTAMPGDVVLWDSRLWHGTLENISGADRWALIATLVSWWVKPAMNMTRSLPQGIYQELTNEQKALIGFCSIPPDDEFKRINTKTGYETLKPRVEDYF